MPGDRPRSARSIPACAGEPQHAAFRDVHNGVYPRVCGGTPVHLQAGGREHGLSPRVRGNRHNDELRIGTIGSIPACAGEPTAPWPGGGWHKVYPRVCGGTDDSNRSSRNKGGLSPRVRGNRRVLEDGNEALGSIPACAGEPSRRALQGRPPEVYPRVCGGTSASSYGKASAMGLSPRVRGNRLGMPLRVRLKRSIPACAGEPVSGVSPAGELRVYPRVCGGTDWPAWPWASAWGLSPRVRGNLRWALEPVL